MKVLFIASTLPFWFLKNKSKIRAHVVVARNIKIFKMFKSLQLSNYEEILIFDKILLDRNKFDKIFSKSNEFIVFHECCWNKLDNIILKYKIPTKVFPVSHLNYFNKVDVFKLIIIIIKYGYSKTNLKNILKFIYWKFIHINRFKYHLMPTEGGNKNSFILVKELNYKASNFIQSFSHAHGFNGSENIDIYDSDIIVFLISDDVINIKIQMDYYNSIIKFCHSKNLRVYCKAHPECRASFDEFNFDKVIKKNIPFEVMELKYRYKISLFSTSLIFQPQKSISVYKIMRNDKRVLNLKDKFNLRSKHLKGFKNYNKISTPKTIENLFQKIVEQ